MKILWIIAFLILAMFMSGCTAERTDDTRPVTTAAENAVNITGFAFNPATITVTKGTTVGWKNSDGAPHTVSAVDNTFTSETLNQGDTFSYTFDKVGTFEYRCSIHPNMLGRVIVTES